MKKNTGFTLIEPVSYTHLDVYKRQVLKLLAGLADDEVDRRMLAALDPAETPRLGQDQLFQHIVHVADLMGEQRGPVALNAEFNGAFDIDVEAVQG